MFAALAVVLCVLASSRLFGQEVAADTNSADTPKTIAARTEQMRTLEGLFTVHIDDDAGAVWLELPKPDKRGVVWEGLLLEGLRSGLGSNAVGLDRGQLGASRLVVFRIMGGKLLIEEENTAFRALTENDAERQAVRESFAPSVLWGHKVDLRDPDGRLLVDFSSFIVRDSHSIARRLTAAKQGAFSLDAARSAVDTTSALDFPDNTVFEGLLTFASAKPGSEVAATAADATSPTFRVRQTLVRLPDDGYVPRAWDPRIGCISISFLNYAAPLNKPLQTRWITRHRLTKTNPAAASSPVVKPIVYYVDRGAPEPIKSALIEGASWWAQAYADAGFENAFVVREAPVGVNPLDVRYNFIQWVHRSTRGWSYGGSVVDPRTGEIIKGHVSLGSLRIRQDQLLFEGPAGVDKTGSGDADDPIELALARIRQLAAHEVGHTLGFSHNFAASTWGDRASVMDYPAPRVRPVGDNTLDFSDAYAVGIGVWDKHALRWAYGQFAPGADESAELNKIAQEGVDKGYLFLTDQDARPLGAPNPRANLWDNGSDPAKALNQTMKVRAIAMRHFGERNIALGQPLAHLQEVFLPLYFHHRYQVQATAKVVGGVNFTYAVKGDHQPPSSPVNAAAQRRAIDALTATLMPQALLIPERVTRLLLPRPANESSNREIMRGHTGGVFDPYAAASAAADTTIRALLAPARLERVAQQHVNDPAMPGLIELRKHIFDVVLPIIDSRTPYDSDVALRLIVQRVLIERLIDLGDNAGATAAARGFARNFIKLSIIRLPSRIEDGGSAALGQSMELRDLAQRWLDRPYAPMTKTGVPTPPPPGSPIGQASLNDLSGCGVGDDLR